MNYRTMRCTRIGLLSIGLQLGFLASTVAFSLSLNCYRTGKSSLSAVPRKEEFLSNGSLILEAAFEDFPLPPWLVERCSDLGFNHPSHIQEQALPVLLGDAEDALIQAETGSGKTLAYLLPALAKINPSRSATQVLIVVPTRELGLQVARVAKRLAAGYVDGKIMIMSVLEGSSNRRQRAWAWADPPHVVIGTPTELVDILRLGGMKRYNSVSYLVVDEMDACPSQELSELLSKYLSPTYIEESLDSSDWQNSGDASTRPASSSRQTVFCSATVAQPRHFLAKCRADQWTLRPVVHIKTSSGLPPSLQHAFIVCRSAESKIVALERFLGKLSDAKVLVFCQADRPLQAMSTKLTQSFEKCSVSILKMEDSLSERAKAMDEFRGDGYRTHGDGRMDGDGEDAEDDGLRILLSTDLAGRGLDIPGITHVVHFDLANDVEMYVHRSGRAGRLGRSGQVVALVLASQEFVWTRLSNQLGLESICLARQKVRRQMK